MHECWIECLFYHVVVESRDEGVRNSAQVRNRLVLDAESCLLLKIPSGVTCAPLIQDVEFDSPDRAGCG